MRYSPSSPLQEAKWNLIGSAAARFQRTGPRLERISFNTGECVLNLLAAKEQEDSFEKS